MNKENFLAVADMIETKQRFNMDWFAHSNIELNKAQREVLFDLKEDCNTVGCVAGWTMALFASPEQIKLGYGFTTIAREYLDISYEQAQRLFYANEYSIWSRIADEYDWDTHEDGGLINWSDITANQAADVLRRIVKGEIDL